MSQFIRVLRGRLFFFKRIRIGIRRVRSSFKTIFFMHSKYFIFCFIIAFIQLLRIKFISLIDKKIPLSTLITEWLTGQNFFDVLIDYQQEPLTISNFKLILIKNLIFFIELLIIFHTTLALVYYVSKQVEEINLSIFDSFKKSIKKFKILSLWIIIQMIIMLVCAILGFIGEFIQFFWQISTSLSLQIIAFENRNIIGVIKDSLNYFKKMFGNFVGIDLFIDGILVILTAFFYLIYKTQVVPTFGFLSKPSETNFILISIIFYLVSILIVSESITFTWLYKIYHIHPKKLEKL